MVCGTLMKKMDRYFIWFFCLFFLTLLLLGMSQKKFLSQCHCISIQIDDKIKKIDIEDGLKCKTANSYLKFLKYVSHEVPRNLIEKILNIALICESKPVTGNL